MPETNIGQIVFDSRSSSLLNVRLNGLPYNDKYCIGGEKDYHRILWTVEDGCGNINTCSYLFRLEDCKEPTPVCKNLSTVVMPSSGSVTIWAEDFNASSFDDCTPAADLLYSFTGDEYNPSKEFNCDTLIENGSTQFIVEIWVADEGNDLNCNGIITWDERNKDYCTTFIVVDDNESTCLDIGPLGGAIETEEAAAVVDVSVTMTNALGYVIETDLTGSDGRYAFLNPLLDHEVTPSRNDDHDNGVSTLDLVRIQKHLLGLEPFTSPYKLIASDANNSQSVSAIDLVEIRKLILGLYIEYPNNTSWRFVDADFEFEDTNNPWPFDEIKVIQGGMAQNEDFVAVKVGDVNGTVSANILGNDPDDEVANKAGIVLGVEDRDVTAGEEIEISVTGRNFQEMLGYQFTMQLEGLQLTAVDAGAIDMNEENVAVHNGAVTMSWHRTKGATVRQDDELFTLRFTAQYNGRLSDMIELGSSITRAEAYTESSGVVETVPVGLDFVEQPVKTGHAEFALYQNAPNPFADVTTIGFDLPEAMSATLTFYDAAGRVIYTVDGDYSAGYNEMSVRKDDLNVSGIVYYRLDADTYSASKKMIIIH